MVSDIAQVATEAHALSNKLNFDEFNIDIQRGSKGQLSANGYLTDNS